MKPVGSVRILALAFVLITLFALNMPQGSTLPVAAQGQRTPLVGLPTQAQANKIVLENRKPGTARWKSRNFANYLRNFRDEDDDRQRSPSPADIGSGNFAQTGWQDMQVLKGYTDKTSINIGESINFYISSTAAAYDLTVYRMGWYGGNGAAWAAEADNLPGQDYGVPTPDPNTGLIAANWPVAYTLQTGTDWVSGIYLVWLAPHGATDPVTYIPFVIRDDANASDILYQVAITTYQAYNAWGGKSLYDYNSIDGRAYKVSYDRPYDHDDGAGLFFSGDYNMVRWMESQGYNITYATSVDLETNPNLLANHKVFLSNFHDEYWSKNMRDHLTAARDQGKHLAFFTSNNIYWQIRFENSSTGAANRVQVGYKDAALDPMSNSLTPGLTTVLWRDPLVNQPENALLGLSFQDAMGYGENYPWVVTNSSHWIYAGTGLHDGDSIPMLVGYEFDKVQDNGQTPANLTVLSNSPIGPPYSSISNASIYTAPSGAMVFDASTNYWAYLLDGNWIWAVDPRVRQMTTNLLNRMITIVPDTPVPTNTPTFTPIPPTNTPTATNTSTPTSPPAPTFVPPTNTPVVVPTNTPVPPTFTPVPPTATKTRTPPPVTSTLKVQYMAGDRRATTNWAAPYFEIVNTGTTAVPLSQLKLRYWFTWDTKPAMLFGCSYASMGCANVSGIFNSAPMPVAGADSYVELSFTTAAGNVPAYGSFVEIDTSLRKADGSTFTQTNDYSFDATKTAFADWPKVTLYRNGVLVWGTEPR